MNLVTQPRQKIDQYELLDHLSDGQGCHHYLAQDWQLYRHVVLKVPVDAAIGDVRTRGRLEHETHVHQHLGHSAFQQALPQQRTSQVPYLVLEDLPGQTLREFLVSRQGVPLEVSEVQNIMGEVCEVLSFLHGQGFVHGDLKPEHILLLKGGGVRITGLGLSERCGTRRRLWEQVGFPVGTPGYLAPERWWGHPSSVSSDIYALGCILYELLCGHPPFGHTNAYQLLVPQATMPPPDLLEIRPEVHSALATLVMRAIRRQPAKRYASIDALHEDLTHLEQIPLVAYQPEPAAWGGQYRLLLLILLLTFIMLVGLLAFGLLAQGVHTGKWF